MKKNILIIGIGAKTYALAKKMSIEHNIFVAPDNSNFHEFATGVDIRENNISELLEFVMENDISMTIVLSQKAIKSNIAEIFSKNNQLIFAPNENSAEITFNKVFAKKTFYRLRIPTPKFGIFEKSAVMNDYIKKIQSPFVIKTNDDNSATIVYGDKYTKIITESIIINSENKIIVEDYVSGVPFTYYIITDGYKALPINSSIQYKHSLDGNGGQLTSGMASCVPNYKLTESMEYYLMDNVAYPVLEYIRDNAAPYVGILGFECILTENNEIYVLGCTSFMNDTDCASIIELLDEDIYKLFEACTVGSFSDEYEFIKTKDRYGITIVLQTKSDKQDNVITGMDNIDDNSVCTLYPNTCMNKYFELTTQSGNVLSITSFAGTVSNASNNVYNVIKEIQFSNKHFRKDICKFIY